VWLKKNIEIKFISISEINGPDINDAGNKIRKYLDNFIAIKTNLN